MKTLMNTLKFWITTRIEKNDHQTATSWTEIYSTHGTKWNAVCNLQWISSNLTQVGSCHQLPLASCSPVSCGKSVCNSPFDSLLLRFLHWVFILFLGQVQIFKAISYASFRACCLSAHSRDGRDLRDCAEENQNRSKQTTFSEARGTNEQQLRTDAITHDPFKIFHKDHSVRGLIPYLWWETNTKVSKIHLKIASPRRASLRQKQSLSRWSRSMEPIVKWNGNYMGGI